MKERWSNACCSCYDLCSLWADQQTGAILLTVKIKDAFCEYRIAVEMDGIDAPDGSSRFWTRYSKPATVGTFIVAVMVVVSGVKVVVVVMIVLYTSQPLHSNSLEGKRRSRFSSNLCLGCLRDPDVRLLIIISLEDSVNNMAWNTERIPDM
jgi:hypothetical protein